MPIGEWIQRNAKRYPDKTAILFEGNIYTFKEFEQRVNRLCNALISIGIKKGHRVAVLLDNCNQFVEAHGACAKGGFVLVPLNTMLNAEELAYIVNNAETAAMIFDAKYLKVVESLRSKTVSVMKFIMAEGTLEGMMTYDQLLESASPEEPIVNVTDDDLLYIAYTSGTTGLPKGAMISHRNHLFSTIDNVIHYRLQARSKICICLPMFFQATVGCAIMPCFYLGATMILQRKFDAGVFLETIEKEKITFAFLAPSPIIFLLEHPDLNKYDYSSLEVLMYGSAPMPVAKLEEAMKVFPSKFIQSHGFTENTCCTTSLEPEDHILEAREEQVKRLSSCGKEMINVNARVVNEKNEDVKLGEVGELVVKGEKVMRGYWKNPEATAEAIDKNGWLHSGDLATMDEEGYIFIVDRQKDMIISGGINIYPKEIEEVIFSHPSVLEVAVIGIPDERWGESVKAIVALKEGMKATAEEIIDYCREHSAGYKKPKSVDFIDKLPRNPGGKVLKRELRKKYWEGREKKI